MKAIEKIENGAQEYRIGNRTVRRADLASLYAELERVDAKLSQLERPSITAAVEASTAWASPSRAVSTSSPINWLLPTGMM